MWAGMASCAGCHPAHPGLPRQWKRVINFRPPAHLLKDLRAGTREQNMAGVSAIHHSLSHVNYTADYVDLILDIGVPAHRPGMYAHAQRKLRMGQESSGDLN